MRVLLVDDSETGQFVIGNLLRRTSGNEVDIAADGVRAWDLLRRQTYDLVLSDILMPRLDGFELCYLVKSTEKTRHIPFIFFSAEYLSPEDQAFAQKLGAARYIFMTEDPIQFTRELEVVLQMPRDRFPPPPDPQALDEHVYLREYKERLFHQLNEKIEELEETTAQWQEERRAVERLRELDRLKDNFIAMLSHELRNPLTTIIGFCDLLLNGIQGPLPEEQRKSVEIIDNRSQHLLALIDRMLDFIRLRAKDLPARLEAVGLPGMVERVVTALQPQAAAQSLHLDQELPGNLALVEADPQLLEQVLIILLDNAIKFTPAGGRVRVAGAGNGQQVKLQVSDTGMGIAPDDLNLIFEPFRQGAIARSQRQQGLGLGLAIARQFMNAMNGRIEVESVPQQGTTFTLVLPTAADGKPDH